MNESDNKSLRSPDQDVSAALLAQREADALRWTSYVRIGFVLIGTIVLIPATDVFGELYAYLNLLTLHVIAQVVILFKLRKPHNVSSIGRAGVITDIVLLCTLPVVWHLVYTSETDPLMHLTQHNLTGICVMFIALNGLTLRPLYPALVTIVAVALHVFLAWLGVNDPALAQYPGGLDRAMGIGRDTLDIMLVTPLFVTIAGCFVMLAAHAARSTVRETVVLEQRERQLREQHLHAIMGAKMEAVGGIVAGLQHEVNSPLGALRSAANTAQKAVDQVRSGDADEPTRERALSAVAHALSLINQTGERLSEVMTTLRDFVQLDRAELQHIHLADLLKSVLEQQRPSFRDDTEVMTEIDDVLTVQGDPRQLTEALATVIRNAGEAFDNPGELKVQLLDIEGSAQIEVTDTGRGMSPEQVAQLFDIDFTKGTRTYARFGLPLCRSIIHGHGGDIEVESEPGNGTRVIIRLPLIES